MTKPPENRSGHLMRAESAESVDVFRRAAMADHSAVVQQLDIAKRRAIYTVARGSSDAVATVLAYEMMRETGIAVTSLPPSVFSLGTGVRLDHATILVISQSGTSDDLVRTARGARAAGAAVVAITNRSGSAVSAASDATVSVGAGAELAVPATKSVIGSIAAGMALIGAMRPGYHERCLASTEIVAKLQGVEHPDVEQISAVLQQSRHVYVIGRDAGYGAAREVALKLKECCALHAEAFSSSEVLHGPMQLVTHPLTVLMLDTEDAATQASMNLAEARFQQSGCTVLRIRPSDVAAGDLLPAAAAAVLIYLLYPIILSAALALGFDPDRPDTLAKETLTV